MTKSFLRNAVGHGPGPGAVLWRSLAGALMLSGLAAVPGAHGQDAPQLLSVTPPNGTTNASIDASIVFVFDEPMDTDVVPIASFPPFLVGNFEVAPANRYLSGEWNEDGMTLTFAPVAALPLDTTVTWTLNPAGSVFPFASATGTPLGTVSGSFKTASTTGGEEPCTITGIPSNWGSYGVTKNAAYAQTSAADPLPVGEIPFLFSTFLQAPASGPAITEGAVTQPDNITTSLEGFGNTFFYATNYSTEAALEVDYPDGSYTLRFTQSGRPEWVIPMTMPPSGPPVPKITNFLEAQSVDPAQEFTLRWGEFTGAGVNDFINLTLSDALGRVVFQAPNPCLDRELPNTAISVVIPADTLVLDQTYDGNLTFSRGFYFSTNTVPEMSGFGSLTRTTQFTLNTGEGGGPGLPDPANLTGGLVLPNGNPQFDLTGTPLRAYTVERTGDMTIRNWVVAGTATMDATGRAVFEDTDPSTVFPAFYRAIGVE